MYLFQNLQVSRHLPPEVRRSNIAHRDDPAYMERCKACTCQKPSRTSSQSLRSTTHLDGSKSLRFNLGETVLSV
jgi:hypothetical protein